MLEESLLQNILCVFIVLRNVFRQPVDLFVVAFHQFVNALASPDRASSTRLNSSDASGFDTDSVMMDNSHYTAVPGLYLLT